MNMNQAKEMDELLCKLLLGQLQSLGWLTEPAASAPKAGLREPYGRWLQQSAALLAQLHPRGDAPVDVGDAWQRWDQCKGAWLENPDTKAGVALVETMLRALPEILTGKRLATDIMFPKGSMKLVEGVYQRNRVADHFNEVLADTVAAYVAERLTRDPSARLRLLEIGAGTGGTSAMVLSRLEDHRDQIEEYCYTDLSKAFLHHAEREYGPRYPFLNYRIFDVEVPIQGQGIEADRYDLVIAANVLHATGNIRRTLRHAKAALRTNGLLLLNEITGTSLSVHLTFGLLEGWWRYEDPALRVPGSPALAPATWKAVLQSEGFRSVFFPLEKDHALGQQVIVAESDGVVCQPLAQAQAEQPAAAPAGEPAPRPAGKKAVRTGAFEGADVTEQMVEDQVRETLTEKLSESLQLDLDQIDIEESFGDYGLDSITGIDFIQAVNQDLAIDLETTHIFDHSSVKQLSAYVLANYRDGIAASLAYHSQPPENRPEGPMAGEATSPPPPLPKQEVKPLIAPRTRVEAGYDGGIAVIGMSGRFAGAQSVNELWEHLAKGKDLIDDVSRWDFPEADLNADAPPNFGSFLSDCDKFDPAFFNISGVEARYMDPQQRLFLEESWKALEDAGYAGESMQGYQCGVYVGCHAGDYHGLFGETPPPQAFWGNASSVVPARIAYHLNLQGPAVAIDTACSSSLVAIHLACQALRAGETAMAVAGGVFVQATPGAYLAANRAGMLSRQGRCFTFDERADGFVFGEGVGVIVLKQLDQAVADRDHIYGVIRGSGMNQDGATSGITAPSADSQARLERQVYETFDIDPEGIQMVEAHGTATQLGDPIEFKALTQAFRSFTEQKQYCAIGSIKTNIGHASAAAGVAGLIKILLALKHSQIPPSLHYRSGNANIRIEDSPFYVNTDLKNWDVEPHARRRAALSSFGFSGTNAHMVIEEAPPLTHQHADKPGYLIVLSARTAQQLEQRVKDLVDFCQPRAELDLGDMSHTLLLGRRHFGHRLACVARNGQDLVSALTTWLNKGRTSRVLVSALHERDRAESSSLKRFGNQCLAGCRQTTDGSEYLEHLATIADLYVQGYGLDFAELFVDEPYARIPLPAYPFARDPYWVEEDAGKQKSAAPKPDAEQKTATASEAFELLTFEEHWQTQAVPPADRLEIKTLVCFLSHPQGQQTVADAVAGLEHGPELVFIALDADERQTSRRVYGVSNTRKDAFEQVFRRIRDDHGAVDALLYLWPLEDPDYVRDYACIVSLLQALAASGLQAERLLLAGQGDDGLDRCYLESWIGFERSLGLVLPRTRVATIIGVTGEQPRPPGMEDWAPRLLAELQLPRAHSALYQAGRRHVCRIRPTTPSPGPAVTKEGGTYLITGGCGGLGMVFAEHLARKHPVNLILTGRSELNHDKRTRIQALEDLGSRVRYLRADICDAGAMREGLDRAKADFGAVHGVIHAAGIPGSATLFEQDTTGFEKVLAPKITGTRLLDELVAAEPLDFICYFSSAAAILGDFGSCDYSLSNRFQMAHARYRHSRQRPGKTLAVNWPTWRDGGMGFVEDESTAMYLQSSGQRLLETQEGVEIFDRLLAGDSTQQLVLAGQPGRVQRFLERMVETPPSTNSASRRDDAPASAGQGRREEMRGFSVAQCLELDLKQQVASLLGVPRDRLDLQANLADFGFDSISLADFARVLSQYYGIDLTPSVFFGHSTLGRLSQYLFEEHPAVTEFYREESAEPTPGLKPAMAGPAEPSPRPTAAAAEPESGVAPPAAEPGTDPEAPEPIAIIGMSGRFPQARNVDELWQILVQGRDAVADFPEDRFYEGSARPEGDSRWRCGTIPGVAEFDPRFFEISPRDAERMDPRQRLLLQESWRALEDAGFGAKQIAAGSIGVYVGVEQGDYQSLSQGAGGDLTGNHDAVLASRLAYFLDLSGPVMAMNTACSSGLVAAHQACVALRNGECDTAIAAAVNLMLTPEAYVGMSHAGMLSEDGVCRAFDAGANGMVPGEAVAALVLKPLSRAQADGDPIHALIRGSGINYDGKTNGITAPSGVAQTRLLQAVHGRYRINPADIEYIVTHGTGTRLGDPVEINALRDSFKDRAGQRGSCALTSSKTNFGHSFAASGLLSLIGLVQAMRHETIPASLHCERENELIDWEQSPFYVNKANKPWPRRQGQRRTGAVSAFGVSGTNAHMVVESDDLDLAETGGDQDPCYLLVLSAKTPEALQDRIDDLIAFLKAEEKRGHSLADISHTLLEARAHFPYRCAVVIQDRADAVRVLQRAGGGEKRPNLFKGTVARDFTGQKAMRRYVQDLVSQCQASRDDHSAYQEILFALAEVYCQGYEIPWDSRGGDNPSRRVHLPGYPFSREQYWITEPTAAIQARTTAMEPESLLHPLLHHNTSDLSEQRFSSTFTGKEFFLADHLVGGVKILPGVAYLEMARAAVERAAGTPPTSLMLENVVWMRPMAVADTPVQVHIGLFPEDGGGVAYEIYANGQADAAEPVVYSRGRAVPCAGDGSERLDLPALKAECDRHRVGSTECYDFLQTLGLEYGPGFRGIETIHVGSERILAKLALPAAIARTRGSFVLHPTLLDSALQASAAALLTAQGEQHQRAAIPFALERLELRRPCQASMWALIHSETGATGRKLDIELCDDDGLICARLEGFTAKVPSGERGPVSATEAEGTLLLEPDWAEESLPLDGDEIEYAQHLVLLCGSEELSPQRLEGRMPGARCLALPSEQTGAAARFESTAVNAFEVIKRLLQARPGAKVLCQILVSLQDRPPLLSALSALLETARLESPSFAGQLVEIDPGESGDSVAEKLLDERRHSAHSHIRYQNGKRLVHRWREIESIAFPAPEGETTKDAPAIPWRERGVYLITGGAGGLGRLVARDILERTEGATLILTGRSPLDTERSSRLETLQKPGTKTLYRQVDVTDEAAVIDLIRGIREEFGDLHGIFHSAGILRDSLILNKTRGEMQQVLAPKVSGLVNLDRASEALPLDFFVLFSSVSGALGSSGQADYATANAFMDAYAVHRNSRLGHSRFLAINWPLWQAGGMSVDAATERLMRRNTGLVPMPTDSGIQALYRALSLGKNRVMVLAGDLARIGRLPSRTAPVPGPAGAEPPSARPTDRERGSFDPTHRIQQLLIGITAELMKFKPRDLDAETELSEYGFDSISLTELANAVNQAFGLELTPTVFFEYTSIGKLAAYLAKTHGEVFAEDDTGRPGAVNGFSDLPGQIQHSLIRIAAELMKFKPQDLDAETELSEYGFDSISLTELANSVNQEFGLELTPAVFFEYPSIGKLAGYLAETHAEAFSQNAAPQAPGQATAPRQATSGERPRASNRSRFVPRGLPLAPQAGSAPATTEPMAVVGMSCRFPMAKDADEFWSNLVEGKDCIEEIPASRWDWREYYGDPEQEKNKTRVKWGGFIEGIENFDPLFFGISPREAELMDPQQRLLMTQVWLALEDAGIPRETLSQHSTGVFIAAGAAEYLHNVQQPRDAALSMTAAAPSMIPNRISYLFNLRGPSEYCETACSSALVALHRAIQAIRQGECEQAIVGAVNLLLSPAGFIGFDAMGYLSPDGKSRSFQAGSNGYVRSEGVGVVVLKPLQKAVDDGDIIQAVIRGTGVSHGGKGMSLTAPNAAGMKAAMAQAFETSGVDPRTLSYIEAHGISSPLGDGIEIGALQSGYQDLAAAHREHEPTAGNCLVGSLKPSIGHGELVSGMSALIKVMQALRHRLIPGIPDFTEPNGNIPLAGSGLRFSAENQPWEALTDSDGRALPRRAAINSYGFGGVNAHTIVEEYQPSAARPSRVPSPPAPQILVLSARNQDRLRSVVHQLLVFLEDKQTLSLADLAYTLQVGREAMECRLALVANDLDGLKQGLRQYLRGGAASSAIPLFSADADDDEPAQKTLLSGTAGELEKLALHWTRGGAISWEELHAGKDVRRIKLPAYPFADEKYWIASAGGRDTSGREAAETRQPADTAAAAMSRDGIIDHLITLLSQELKIPADQIKTRKPFQDYGVDSIVGLHLTRGLAETFQCRLGARELLEYPTVESLAEHLAGAPPAERETTDLPDRESAGAAGERETRLQIPLSEGQKGLWMLHRLHPRMGAYNVPMALRIPREIDTDAFRKACEFALCRHALLGAVVQTENDEPYLTVPAESTLFFQSEDLGHLGEDEVLAVLRKLAAEAFDLETGPLMRIHLFSRSQRESIVLVTMHHIICDGRSTLLLVETLQEAYAAYRKGETPEPRPPQASYHEFVQWEQDMLAGREGNDHLTYWTEQLSSGQLPSLRLPTDHARPKTRSFRGRTHAATLDTALSRRIREQASALRVGVPVLLLGAFKALLYRYTGQRDMVVGMPTMGRPQRRFEDVLGYFVNPLPIRSRLSGDLRFSELLAELRLTLADGLDHAAYPFPLLVRELNVPRDQAAQPIYQVSYTYQNFLRPADLEASTDLAEDWLGMAPVAGIHQEGDDEFGLEVIEEQDQFRLNMSFDPDLFESATIERLMVHYRRLIQSAVETPERRIADLAMLTDQERRLLLSDWCGTVSAGSEDRPVQDSIALQAAETPEATALVCTGRPGRRMSYRQLDERAHRLACHLRNLGLAPGATIGVFLERSPEMIIALLAIWKAGGVYLPLDPDSPPDRLGFLLEDAGIGAVLVQDATEARIRAACLVVNLDQIGEAESKASAMDKLESGRAPEDPAYVLYTSGSTGKPKGVVVSHAAIARHCRVMREYYELASGDRVLQFASLHVDVSLEQILPGLLCGATLILKDQEIWSAQTFHDRITEHAVTVADIPPMYLRELLNEWSAEQASRLRQQLRLVIVGGEALAPETVDSWRDSPLASVRLVNAYGPTETTITSVAFDVTAGSWNRELSPSVPIGRPLSHSTAYILDGDGNALPAGVPGELYVGGSGVAIGYLNRPKLTAESFLHLPLAHSEGDEEVRVYRTRDLARYIPGTQGLIEFLGRRDHQIKIRGFRVELGEIEARLAEHGDVKECVVVANRDKRGDQRPVAYVVPKQGRLSEQALTEFLKERLPGHMLPTAYVWLDTLPTNSTAKVDRLALPLPEAVGAAIEPGSVAPRDNLEMRLAQLWSEVLELERIGVQDDFFELGGHSILSIRLMAAISRELGRDLPISSLIEGPTIADQAKLLRRQLDSEPWTPLVPIRRRGDQTPLFCIHPVGGNVLCYMPLARHLDRQRPVYGLRSSGHEGGDPLHSLEEMALAYIEAIREIQPHGPYHLLGWSQGGVIAYEMARQLSRTGEETARLVLVESYTPAMVKRLESEHPGMDQFETGDPETRLLMNFARALLGMPVADILSAAQTAGEASRLLDWILDEANRANLLLPGKASEQIHDLLKVFRANTQAFDTYVPQSYHGSLTLICGDAETAAGQIGDPTRGWGSLAIGGLTMHILPADHYTILEEPSVEGLAKHLQA